MGREYKRTYSHRALLIKAVKKMYLGKVNTVLLKEEKKGNHYLPEAAAPAPLCYWVWQDPGHI